MIHASTHNHFHIEFVEDAASRFIPQDEPDFQAIMFGMASMIKVGFIHLRTREDLECTKPDGREGDRSKGAPENSNSTLEKPKRKNPMAIGVGRQARYPFWCY